MYKGSEPWIKQTRDVSSPPFCVSSEGILAFRKEITYKVLLYVAYSMQFYVFFPKNPGTTCAEIYEKEQGKKSAKSLSFLAAYRGPNLSAHAKSLYSVY